MHARVHQRIRAREHAAVDGDDFTVVEVEPPADLWEKIRTAIGLTGAAADAIAALIDAHTVVMAHGHADPAVEESLATWLSLLDDDAWRERVREVRVDQSLLRERELVLLARVAAT